jgi:hypothetical protein
MSAPNIAALQSITARTAVQLVSTTPTAVVTNAAASNTVIKISSLYISNVNGAYPASVTVDIYRSSVAYRMGSTITVPADSTLDLISKAVYLEEGDTLRLTASLALYLEAVCSYEIIT